MPLHIILQVTTDHPSVTALPLPMKTSGLPRLHNSIISHCVFLLFYMQYKSTPCKKITLTGWIAVLPDDPDHPNIFQLNDPDKGKHT